MMMQRLSIVLLVLALACSALIVGGSCATKKMRVGEESRPADSRAAVEGERGQEPEEARLSPEEAERRKEAERQAKVQKRMSQREKEQMVLSETQAFEAEPIYFDFDESILKPEARATLDRKAAWLRANSQYSVRIEGHCDERGTSEYNVALGEKRAVAAAEYLRQLGIAADRVSTISYGEERPADPEHFEEAWAKNRRDEFRLMKR